MIDERKLIDEMTKEYKKYYAGTGKGEDFTIAMQMVMNQPKIGEWIPCSERLPEKNDIYLITLKDSVTIKGSSRNSDCYITSVRCFNARRKKWNSGLERDNPGMEIIAWKPLPEPYKEGD